jgi:1-acyl-sn-glycerol-3-phosphate acyltransferase
MYVIKTGFIFFWAGLSMTCLSPLGIIIFIFSSLGLKEPMAHFVYRLARAWAKLLLRMIGCKVRVSGLENIPAKGGVCFVCNHGSLLDVLLLLAYTGRPIGFIAKKEFAYVPMLNIWILLVGGLFMDRKSPRRALKTIEAGVRHIKAGGVMLIFPEGRRSRGEGLLPFHAGSFKLATQSGAVVAPAAITGSYAVFEQQGLIIGRPVSLTFCKTIETKDLPKDERRQALVNQAWEEIRDAMEGALPGSTAPLNRPAPA